LAQKDTDWILDRVEPMLIKSFPSKEEELFNLPVVQVGEESPLPSVL